MIISRCMQNKISDKHMTLLLIKKNTPKRIKIDCTYGEVIEGLPLRLKRSGVLTTSAACLGVAQGNNRSRK